MQFPSSEKLKERRWLGTGPDERRSEANNSDDRSPRQVYKGDNDPNGEDLQSVLK